MKIAIGCDHGGYDLKEHLAVFLKEKGYEIKDCGTFSRESCDYPVFGEAAARAVAVSYTHLLLRKPKKSPRKTHNLLQNPRIPVPTYTGTGIFGKKGIVIFGCGLYNNNKFM